ncbi:hypothetical protein BDB00DRAFT_831699 [Zychaea mexicana]|uniref:uncharacterized protein n=1 Tax=Zychaea mexicana TaxID=64656 RepID=UPI0022FDEC7A|nr:uncharacterized protein BDB00DRAFT_831699 [Zychaea mexicana]KAI9491678.1 hypothetical protein BDB00DRAFT_831699 [Zychaea mexicana]
MQASQRPEGGGSQNASSATLVAHQRALIPSTSIEFPTQRLYALSIFVVLQTVKLTDLLQVNFAASYPEEYAGIFIRWWILDALYMAVLWIVQIPWLQFSSLKTMLIIAGFFFLDLFLFVFQPVAFFGFLLKVILGESQSQQMGVSKGKMVDVKDILQNSSHILGRHTVHILPYGTAKLNPDGESYCIPERDIGTENIYIPVVLNNTTPSTISLSRYDFDSKTSTVFELSGRDIHRANEIGHGKQGLEYYVIKVREPGAYKLDEIVSKDGLHVQFYNRLAYVFVCPTARFTPVSTADYCSGDKETLELQVSGVAPLKVEYNRHVNKRLSSLKLDRIQPENFESPLTRMKDGLSEVDQAFFTSAFHQDNFNWAATEHLTMNLDLSFKESGEHVYYINRVIDGVGNVVEINDPVKNKFIVHGHPKVQFQCSATDPVNLLIGEDSTNLPLSLEGSSPWKLEYEYTSEVDEGTTKLKTTQISDSKSSLKAHAPGEYKLLRVSDKFCRGDVLLPSTCQVVQPPPPLIRVDATPVPSECADDSEVGMRFAVEFEGAPPYTFEYQVVKNNGKRKTVVEKKRERVDRSRFLFSYLPTSSGGYTYEFLSLDDRNYKNRETNVQSIKQIVHPQPDAKFTGNMKALQSIRTCIGDDVELDVALSGSGPFLLTWTFAKQMYSDVVEGNQYTIKVPRLESAGHHVVSLVKIRDANECEKELEARDVIIDVRRDRPTVFFYTEDDSNATVFVAEGETAKLPLRLTGEEPWKITYRNVESDGKGVRSLSLRDPNAQVEVKKVGTYELLSVEDSICKGDALPPTYTVRWIDKPKLSFVEDQVTQRADGVFERQAVCEGVNDAIDIQFTGHGPYYCAYDQYFTPTGQRSSNFLGSDEIRSGLTKNWIGLRTQESGKYKYSFNKIADQRYTNPFKLSPPLVLEQNVHPIPSVKFPTKSRYARTVCVGDTFDSDDIGAIWLELKGQAPFSVRLGLKHQSEKYGKTIQFNDINANKFKLELTDEVTTPGHYELHLLNVRDGNGCSAEASGPESVLSIEAQDIATIVPAESCAEHCVGDTLEYSLSGVGPFTISYQFNGRNEKVKSQTSRLTMIADKPGNLTIVSVGDQRNKCRSFPKDMTKSIHEIPSSLVSGGREIIENIREGDMVQANVDLVGVPPFDFEWQRSEAIWDSNKKRFFKGNVLESHTVHNVEGHRYSINTSTEGIIEVTRIKDRFCHYPRPQSQL